MYDTSLPNEDRVVWEMREFAKHIRTEIDKRDEREENLRLRKSLRAIRYWEGRQLGFISPYTGQWNDVETELGDPFYPNNQIRFFCRSILKEMTKSRAQFSIQPRDDRMESSGAARLIRGVLDRYRQEHFAPLNSQTEMMFALLEGNYFRYIYWDATINTYTHTVTDYDIQTVVFGRDAYFCQSCGQGGYVPEDAVVLGGEPQTEPTLQEEFPNPYEEGNETPIENSAPQGEMPMISCPYCGQPTEVMPAVTKDIPVPTGEREVTTGDLATDIVDPMEIKVHLRARNIRQTPFLARTRMIHKRLAKRLFKSWDGYSGARSDRYAVQLQTDLEGSPGNYKSHEAKGQYFRSLSSQNDLVEFTQIWIDTSYYFDYTIGADFLDIPGKELAKDTMYLEAFPKGMYMAFIGDVLVDYRDEDKAAHWTHGNYIVAPHRFWGDGAVDDSLDQQWELNNLDSLMVEHIMFNVGGQTWYNQLKIEGSTLGARPRERNPMRNPSPQDNPQNFIYERKPVPMSAEVPGKQEQIKRDMQAQFGAFSVSSGVPDVNVSTATGMAILRDQALGFLGSPLELRGEVDVEWSYQALTLIQENLVGQRYITFGQYDDIEGRWFEGSDIRTDFIITQIPGTWFPVSDFDMRQRAIELAQFGGLPMGIWNPAWSNEVRTFVLEKYNIPVGLNATEPDERKQKIEIEIMREAFSTIEKEGAVLVDVMNNPDPLAVQFVASAVKVEMFVDNDDVQVNFISKYLKTDDGMKEHPVMRAAILMHQQQHIENKMAAQQMLAVMQGIANGSLVQLEDGSIAPNPAMQPQNGGQRNSGGPPKKQNAEVGSPRAVGQGNKRVGDNLRLAQPGSSERQQTPQTTR